MDRAAIADDSVDKVKSEEETKIRDTSTNIMTTGTKLYEDAISADKLPPCKDSAAVDIAHNLEKIKTTSEVEEVGRKVTAGVGTSS